VLKNFFDTGRDSRGAPSGLAPWGGCIHCLP